MIDKIYHIADVHIRNFRRHSEYEAVFKKLFLEIEKTKTQDSVIYLAGDIVHNKTDMSPELVMMTTRFLKGCADILPTILICGNHDTNLNSNRLDTLTPIVESLSHPNLHYFKDTGQYPLNGVTFSVMSVFDPPEKWLPASEVSGDYKIALHHGAINGSHTDHLVLETGVPVSVFDGYDLALLGDIHRFQYLNNSKTVAYAGSLIQQDYGETIENHGLLVWELKTKKSKFIGIPNDYGFFTATVDSSFEVPAGLPKNLRLRVFHNLSPDEIANRIRQIGQRYNIIELNEQRNSGITERSIDRDILIGNSRLVEHQNNLITQYLQTSGATNEELNAVLELNREINKQLPVSSKVQKSVWRPVRLEFENMFSYGSGNIVDFGNFSGAYGIFNQNAQGKSALFDILTFVIYDKSTRTSKASHILNNHKNSFFCKFEFTLAGTTFFITRTGTKNAKTGNVKVDVNFWSVDSDGNETNLNGEDRDKTNYAIRNYLGTYEDFIMTALSTQYDNQNFVEKSQRDRKELLYKMLDIFVYDELYKLAKDNSKELQGAIKEFERGNLHQRSSHLYSSIEENEHKLSELDSKLGSVRNQIKEVSEAINDRNKRYREVSIKEDITVIEQSVSDVTADINKCVDELAKLNVNLEEETGAIAELNDKISKISIRPEVIRLKVTDVENQISNLTQLISKKQSELDICEIKELQLSQHQYDPECKFCMANDFVQEAKQFISKIPGLKQELVDLTNRHGHLVNVELVSAKKDLNGVEEFESFISALDKAETRKLIINERIAAVKYKGKGLADRLKVLNMQRKEYEQNKILIEENRELMKELESLKIKANELEKNEKALDKEHRNVELSVKQGKREYELLMGQIDSYMEFIKKYRIHELYMQSVSRDGVPYKIVEMVLPVLENSVNNILKNIANFNVKIEATDDKYVHAFIQYNDQSWPIEMSCGMERFTLSLAFRIALTDITSLAKTNFLAIDEGFGVLDGDNILQMGKLFEYLKTYYDFIICVSHIETMRDLVDKHIKIDKENGFSRIIYNDAF